MIGTKYGRLTVLALSHRDASFHKHWSCRCSCGEAAVVRGDLLRNGHTKSCGCLKRECVPVNRTAPPVAWGKQYALKHGMSFTREYKTWASMRNRCANPNNPAWPLYGGRGITVCARWDDFQAFLADMGPRPEGHSINRIDNDGNYEPSNCRWATAADQVQNRRVPKRYRTRQNPLGI